MHYKKKLLITLASVMLSMNFNIISFADELNVKPIVKEFLDLKELSMNSDGLHIVNDNGTLYIKDKEDKLEIGLSYDNNGDLYYTGEDGKLLLNGYNEYGMYFDEYGKYINKSTQNKEEYIELSKRFEDGNRVYFNTENELLNFLEYYSLQYRLIDYDGEYYVYTEDNGQYSTALSKGQYYDREHLRHTIISKFGTLDNEVSDYDKLLDVCKKISSVMEYDLGYTSLSLEKALADNKGVCWHFSKIAKILLDEAGIENEIMIGYYEGNSHMWLRSLIDGKWAYIDPTLAGSAWWSYSNMAYRTFIDSYKPIKYMELKR